MLVDKRYAKFLDGIRAATERYQLLLDATAEAARFMPGRRDQDGLLTWWSLAFSGPEGFRGGCLVEAPSFLVALIRSEQLGCNPGGQVIGAGFRASSVPLGYANRRLNRLELDAMPEPEGLRGIEEWDQHG